jgi:hypothetical protein
MTTNYKANPFQHAGFWYWTDEECVSHGPYKTQMDALRGLLKHIDPSWTAQLWALIKDLFRDTKA